MQPCILENATDSKSKRFDRCYNMCCVCVCFDGVDGSVVVVVVIFVYFFFTFIDHSAVWPQTELLMFK